MPTHGQSKKTDITSVNETTNPPAATPVNPGVVAAALSTPREKTARKPRKKSAEATVKPIVTPTAETAQVPAPTTDPDDDVVDASTLDDTWSRAATQSLSLRRRWFEEQPTLVRPITTSLIPASIHYLLKEASGSLVVHCNGTTCALCLGRHKPVPMYLFALFFVDGGEVGVIEFGQSGGAGSLRGALVPVLKDRNCTSLILEISKLRGRHNVAVVATLDDTTRDAADYGDAVLRDLIARGGISAKDVRGVVDRRDNQGLLAALDWLPARIRLYHPGLDLSKL